MAEIDPQEIKRVLDNPAFKELVAGMRTQLTKKVMSTSADAESREKDVAEYHALNRVMTRLKEFSKS